MSDLNVKIWKFVKRNEPKPKPMSNSLTADVYKDYGPYKGD